MFNRASREDTNSNLKAPPIDLNALHTPHKLAAFVVSVPSKKQDYAFLFTQETNTTNANNKSSIINNNNSSHNNNLNIGRSKSQFLTLPIKEKENKKSNRRKKNKGRNKKGKQGFRRQEVKRLNDEEKESGTYDPGNNSVGKLFNLIFFFFFLRKIA